jgi:hypothetical protein
MDYAKLFVKHDSTASFFGFLFIPISSLHVFPRKDTLLKLKVNAIVRERARKDLTLHLLNKLIYSITKREVTFECWMRVKVNIHEESLLLCIVLPKLLYSPTGRLSLRIRCSVVTV